MRLVLSWLKEFVDIDAPADEIAETLGLRGFEVASIEVLGGGDAVIDFEITANRPDCLSVIGLAREVATTFDRPLRLPSPDADARIRLASLAVGGADGIRVAIEDEELCPRYAALVATVTLGPSPAWIAGRLEAAGVRPISTIVDVTNYVNLEIGQPMHAFDAARLAGGEIRVRRAKPGGRDRRRVSAAAPSGRDSPPPRSPRAAARRRRTRWRCRAHPSRPRVGRRARRRRLGRDRTDLPRRSAARSRSHRGSRPPLRLRQARADVSGAHRACAAGRPTRRARSARASSAHAGGPFRGGHVRIHRSEGRRALRDAESAERAKEARRPNRRPRAAGQPAVRQV